MTVNHPSRITLYHKFVAMGLLGFGVLLVYFSCTTTIPKTGDLYQIRGQLDSYYIKETKERWGSRFHATILILENRSRFWTKEVNKSNCNNILRPGAMVRFYIDPHSTARPIDGAVKTYGLWVNGVQIKSADSALSRDKFIVRFVFLGLGIFNISLGSFYLRKFLSKSES